jgi:hypothetical protein
MEERLLKELHRKNEKETDWRLRMIRVQIVPKNQSLTQPLDFSAVRQKERYSWY